LLWNLESRKHVLSARTNWRLLFYIGCSLFFSLFVVTTSSSCYFI